MKKRVFLIALSALMLCSCGEKENEPLTSQAVTTEAATTASEVKATEEKTTEVTTNAEKPTTDESTAEEISEPDDEESSTDESSEESSEAESSESDITEEHLGKLFDENLYCMRSVFDLGSLPYGDEPVQGNNIYKVNSGFASYDEFESYVRSVYCEAEADRLLYNTPYEGDPKYLNVDGELCINQDLEGGKGYYVDWNNYELEIISSDETACEFTVKGILEEPAETVVQEDYIVHGKAVKENGKWVLEKMLS